MIKAPDPVLHRCAVCDVVADDLQLIDGYWLCDADIEWLREFAEDRCE